MPKTKKQIIPYTEEALRWHLYNNVFGLTDYTIDNIIEMCNKVNSRKVGLHSDHLNIGVTPAEMLEDLRIDFNA